MDERIQELERKVDYLESIIEKLINGALDNIIDEVASEYIRERYPYTGSYDYDLCERVKDQITEHFRYLLKQGVDY